MLHASLYQPADSRPGNTRKRLLVLGLSGLLSFGAAQTYVHWRNSRPVFVFGGGAERADRNGPDRAESRARQILSVYRKHNWKFATLVGEIGFENLRLPDQGSAEVPSDRDARTTAWCFPDEEGAIWDDVAFYTELYARRNVTIFRDGRRTASPSGFLIVAMKSGEIKRIPVSETRILPFQGRSVFIFPGVRGYRHDLEPAPGFKPQS